MGLFKKKRKNDSQKNAKGKNAMTLHFENEVMENAYKYSIDMARMASDKKVQGYLENARKHYLNDCMDLEDVELTIKCLEYYNEALEERIGNGDADIGVALATSYAKSLTEEMKKKWRSMR